MKSAATICKYCGARITWQGNYRHNADDGQMHICKPKVRVYTDEEKRAFQAQREKETSK